MLGGCRLSGKTGRLSSCKEDNRCFPRSVFRLTPTVFESHSGFVPSLVSNSFNLLRCSLHFRMNVVGDLFRPTRRFRLLRLAHFLLLVNFLRDQLFSLSLAFPSVFDLRRKLPLGRQVYMESEEEEATTGDYFHS